MRELDETLCALLDGELGEGEAAALRAEIGRRPELAARLAELEAVDEELRSLPGRPLPADLRARLAQRIRAEARTLPRRAEGTHAAPPRRRRRWLAAAALAAAAAALVLVVLAQLRRNEAEVARLEPAPAPAREAALTGVAIAEDLPVIEVLDVLTELDELEQVESG